MGIHIHIHDHRDDKFLQDIRELLTIINQKISTLMSNTDQALQDLQAIGAQIQKIGTETSALLQKISDLEKTTTPDTPQSVLDAIAAVKQQAQLVDDLVPDAPVTPQA